MIFGRLISIVASFSMAVALIISENTITNSPYTFPQETIEVETNVFWSILGYPGSISGDLLVNGEFFISGSTVRFESELNYQYDVENTGTMVINGQSSSIVSLFLNSFKNSGIFSVASTYQSYFLVRSDEWINSGSILISTDDVGTFQTNAVTQSQITNSGDIYLTNTQLVQINPILGNGCIHIQGQSLVSIQYTAGNLLEQTYYLVGSQASLSIFTHQNVQMNLILAGFGDGNIIKMTNPFSQVSYNEDKLVIIVDNVSYTFSIGYGYNFDLFVYNGNTVSYNGPVPNPNMPSNCRPAPPVPIAPQELPQSSSSIVSSSSEISSSTISIDTQTSESESISSSASNSTPSSSSSSTGPESSDQASSSSIDTSFGNTSSSTYSDVSSISSYVDSSMISSSETTTSDEYVSTVSSISSSSESTNQSSSSRETNSTTDTNLSSGTSSTSATNSTSGTSQTSSNRESTSETNLTSETSSTSATNSNKEISSSKDIIYSQSDLSTESQDGSISTKSRESPTRVLPSNSFDISASYTNGSITYSWTSSIPKTIQASSIDNTLATSSTCTTGYTEGTGVIIPTDKTCTQGCFASGQSTTNCLECTAKPFCTEECESSIISRTTTIITTSFHGQVNTQTYVIEAGTANGIGHTTTYTDATEATSTSINTNTNDGATIVINSNSGTSMSFNSVIFIFTGFIAYFI